MKKIRIYLDDVRTPIDPDWIVVRSYDEFVSKVTEIGLENIEIISLDHDLGPSAMAEWHSNVYRNYELNYDNIEEKTSRIIEVVISSVKPFQLMMGKIIGIGFVGLTQFLLWIVLSASLMTLATTILFKDKVEQVRSEMPMNKQVEAVSTNGPGMDIVNAVQTVQWTYILPVFIIFFFGGYMLYSALFAAVGSAVESDTETQQFMLPITLPLLFTYIMSFSFIVNNPDSSLSFWLSIIPFTSPIAMMVRLPFGVPNWELALSIFLLIGGFIFTTWVASRIYRVGILMYGKKVSFKELGKWFMYKE